MVDYGKDCFDLCIPEIFTPYFFKENIYGKG